MKTEEQLFRWLSVITVVSFALSIKLYFCNITCGTVFYDIALGIFSGALVSTISSLIRILVERRNSIDTIIFNVFQIKQAYNKIFLSSNEREFLNGCRYTEMYFQRFADAYNNLIWVGCRKKTFESLERAVFQYGNQVIGSLGAMEDDTASPYECEKSGICAMGEIELKKALVFWNSLCEKYLDAKQYENYKNTDYAFSKHRRQKVKTIDEMVSEVSNNG